MTDPEKFDDDGYMDGLAKGDKRRFREEFNSKYSNIDTSRAVESYRSTFEASDEPEHRLFKDIVNAFSSHTGSSNTTAFSITIANPLYEFGNTGAEVLLAEGHVNGNVHLCFVSCNIGGENTDGWRRDVNNTATLLESESNRESLLRHIESEGMDIRTAQYLTLTRDQDLVGVDEDVVTVGTDPENYAIWKSIEAEIPTDGDPNKEIEHHAGYVEHPDLDDIGRDGIDITLAENDDFKYSLTTHPIFPLGEVCQELYLDKEFDEDEPEEFTRSEFEQTYKEHVYLGEDRGPIDSIVEEKVDELLDVGCEYGMLDDEDEVKMREYRIMWGSDEGSEIKNMVKDKYFQGKAPEEMGYLAFKRAKDDFDPEQPGLGGFDDDE